MSTVSGEAVFDRIERLGGLMAELEPILQSLMLNDSTIIDGLAQMIATLQAMQSRSDDCIVDLAGEVRSLGVDLIRLGDAGRASSREPQSDRFDRDNPEISLLAHLLPYLPNPTAIDVGANVGEVALRLVEAGYEVFAFEPHVESHAALAEKAAAQPRLHAFQSAIGSAEGEAELLLATDTSDAKAWDISLYHSLVAHPMLEDLSFGSSETVPVRTLAGLMREGAIPADPSLLKIDTEGMDLDVVRGAGEARFAVVTTEFWDARHPFGRAGHGDLAATVDEMRTRGYAWHVVIFRIDEAEALGFYVNGRQSLGKSWGNAVFFCHFPLFARAVAWCDDHLSRQG